MKLFAIVLSAALVLAAMPSIAQVADPVHQLRDGEFDALDLGFASLQERYERHEATEFEVLDAFKPFYQRQDTLSADFARWAAARPKSWVPLLARGIYFRKLGELNRGGAYTSQTSPEKLEYMSRMFRPAKADLEAALALHPRLYIAAVHLLNIAQFEGDDASADRMLELADRLQPDNFLARARYLVHLAPRWGGSREQMSAFLARVRRAGLADDKLNFLNAIAADDAGGSLAENRAMDSAQRSFARALELTAHAPPRIRRDYLQFTTYYCPRETILSPDRCE